MPHCIVEHSASLDGERLLPVVFSGTLESGLFEATGSDIKVRAIAYHNYLTVAGKTDFVHVTLKILSGRTLEQKSSLSKLVLSKLQALEWHGCSLTVEVLDIERGSYSKLVC